jgi:integrase
VRRALQWGDVDWEAPALAIRRTWARGDAGEYLDTPKSAARRRVVVVGAGLAAELRSWRVEQTWERWRLGLPDHPAGWVLARADGLPLPVGSLYGHWRAAIAAAGLPYVKIHALRHLAVSEQLAARVLLKVVSARIGHSSLGLMSDLYGMCWSSVKGTLPGCWTV